MAQPRDWWIGDAFLIVNSYEGHPELSCLPQVDKAALDFWTTFYTLRFRTTVCYNRTRQEFESDILGFMYRVAQDASAKYVVFSFIGHGGAGDNLFLQDGSSLTVEKIDDILFQRDILRSKYRILIIDACRGQGVNDGKGGYCPKYPNTILARSTLPHQNAWGAESYGIYSQAVFNALLTTGGTMQSALESAQTQLGDRQNTQFTLNDIPALSLEADVKSAGGRLTPSTPPPIIVDLHRHMEEVRFRRAAAGNRQGPGSSGDNAEEMDTSLGTGSLDTAVGTPPSPHHHGVLHTHTAGLIESVVDIIKAKMPPLDAIKDLYFSLYSKLLEILNPCCEGIRQAAFEVVRMRQVSATEEEVKQAHHLEALFRCLKIDEKWHDITFLGVAIRSLPPEKAKERETALMILNMYRSHLRVYTTATSIKDGKGMFLPHEPGMKETLLVMEVTVNKDPEDYTCSDCLELWKRFLIEALEIPADHIQFIDAIKATFVQALQKNNSAVVKEFLDKMNAPALVQSLVLNELIPDSVEYEIKHSGKRDANGHLLKYMKEDADEKTIQRILEEASRLPKEGKMNKFAAAYLYERKKEEAKARATADGSSGPMSPWNDDALVSLRERLTLNVSMNMGLSDRLEKAEGGFMSRAEAQMVRGLSSNMQQIENVIRILRGKTNEDFATFCTMLRETNHVGWADELEKEAERFKRERKDELKKEEAKARATADFKKSLRAALDKGSVEVEMVKCVTLGPSEAGKTQLRYALIGKFDHSSESTPMCTRPEAVIKRYVRGKSTWEPLTRERLCMSLHTTVKMFTESAAPSTTEANSSTQRNEAKALRVEPKKVEPLKTRMREGTEVHEYGTGALGQRANSNKALRSQFAATRTSVEEELKKAGTPDVKGLDKVRIIHMVDSGGQPAFFDIHPVIATSRAVYLLVYNMEEGLDHKPAITYRSKVFPTKQLQNTKQSNLDMIKDSLLTLHDCKQKFTALEKELRHWFGDSISKSADKLPVLVVGTRKKKESIKHESEKLEKGCSYLPLWRNVLHSTKTRSKLFAVESRVPGCEGVQSVREEVDRARCTFKLPLPISWFLCQLIFLSVDENLHVLTFSNLLDLCQQEGLISNPDEFLAMIRTFHLLGIFSFPYLDQELTLCDQWRPDNKPVFTNPDVLYQQVTKILEMAYRDLAETPMVPEARDSFEKLQCSGQLDSDTLGYLGIPNDLGFYSGFHDYLLERLVHWGLAAKPTTKISEGAAVNGRAAFFIPSVLPACDEEPVTCSESTLSFTFCLSLPDESRLSSAASKVYYVPRGIFPPFILHIEEQGYEIQGTNDQSCLCRDVATFGIEPSHSNKMQYAYNIMVVDKMDRVTIAIEPATEDKSSPADCRRIVSDFKQAMEFVYKSIYQVSLAVTEASTCRCDKQRPSHLAKVIHRGNGCYVMQCLLPGKKKEDNCPQELVELLSDQAPVSQSAPGLTSTDLHEPTAKQQTMEASHSQTPLPHPTPMMSEPHPMAKQPPTGSPHHQSQLDLHRRVLMKCQTHFLQVVAVNEVYRELYKKHVIHQSVLSKITDSRSVQEARGHLFDHMRDYGTLDTLNTFCDVITSEEYDGFQAMQDFGKLIKDMLEQEAATGCVQGPSRSGNAEGRTTSLAIGGGGGGGDAPQSSLSARSMQASGKRQIRANLVQVIQNDADFSEKFLEEMNAGAVGQTLKSLRLISPEVATDIARARSRKEANNVLLQHMQEDADEKKIQKILEVSSKAEGYGKMNNFAASVLRNQQ